ncbi:MAG: hypothetical protein ACTHK8_20185 [Ginsengibacter sp.]
MNFNLMSKQRRFLLVFAAVGFISMFLPWVSISMFGFKQTANGMHREGILVFICFVVTGIIAYANDQKKNLDKTMWTVTILAGAIALLFTIWYYVQITDSVMGASFVGFGLYAAALSALGIVLSAYLLRSPSDNIKEGISNLSTEIKNKFSSLKEEPSTDTNAHLSEEEPSENSKSI